jgi:hypothetical protein
MSNILTEEHKELLSKMVNEWSFKAFVLEYGEEQIIKKFYHRMAIGDSYNDSDAKDMKQIRDKWIRYHKGEYDSKMPEEWAKFKQHKY